MFGCCDHNRIDVVLLLTEHHPKVFVFWDVGELPVEARDMPVAIFHGFYVVGEFRIHISLGADL